jgi:hypothetical protein
MPLRRLCLHLHRLALLSICGAMTAQGAALHLQLPPDALAFVEIDPSAAPAANSQSALLDFGVQALQSTGMLSKQASEVGDILALAAAAGQHHSCVALLDADLRAEGTELECRSVQMVWVLDTGGQSGDMVERLTHLLGHLSSRATAVQTVHKTAEEKKEYVEFRDTTWPAWLCLDWTRQGELFVLTLGSGAMEHYLADRPVGGVPWEQMVGEADAAARKQGGAGGGGDAFVRVYVTPAAFRQRYAEAMQKTQLGKMFATLDLFTTDASLFTARIHERAISMDNATVSGGVLSDVPWTVALGAASPLLKLVPAQATAYLALNVQWPALWTRLMALVDAVAPDDSGERADQSIQDFATKVGVDIRADILAKLQPIVVVHDAPQHPLRLPLMVTAVAAADPAQAEAVKTAFGKLMTGLAADLDRRAGASHEVGAEFTHFRLRTDADGVMYMQFGLVGPAWTWVGNKLVFSWSPGAVRVNEAVVGPVAGEGFGGK